MSNSPYGKRGGTSVNAGKKASTFRVVFPDGSVALKKSFEVHTPTAFAMIYQAIEGWQVSAIVAEPKLNWGNQQPTTATRVS